MCAQPVFGANADDWWTGGIDEVAPTGHPCVVGGEQLPFLGEFWSQPWTHRITSDDSDRVEVHLAASGVISPIRIDRWMSLRAGEPIVRSGSAGGCWRMASSCNSSRTRPTGSRG